MSTENSPNLPTQNNTPEGKFKPATNLAALAMELPFVMVSALAVGALLGYLLDRWLHTKPVFLLLLGAVGFFAGVRDVLRRLPTGTDDRSAK